MMKFAMGYLLLSFLSGFVELGAVIFVIRSSQPLYFVPLAGLAYQMGALLREPIELAPWQYYLALILSVVPATFAFQFPILLFPSVFLLSVGIQGIRGAISKHGKVSTFVKRVSRVAGFACSGFFFVQFLPIIAGLTLFTAILLPKQVQKTRKASFRRDMKLGPLGWIMMVHQSHYFSYAYAIPLVIISHQIDSRLAGLLFCVGWLSYVTSRKVFGEKKLVQSFAIGHILAALSLAGLFFFSKASLVAILILWFLTGFGGGTVYCLRELRAKSTTDRSDLDSWENIGHLLGVVICLAIFAIMKAPELAFATASFIAVITCVSFLIHMTRKIEA